MPELPDVEIFKRLFDQHALGQTIQRVIVKDSRILGDLDQDQFVSTTAGQCFEQTRRHAKHLFARLAKDSWLTLHFGTTGGLSFFGDLADEPPYTRVRFDFAGGGHLACASRRMLGRLGLTTDVAAFIKAQGLGPDALDPTFDAAAFSAALHSHRAALKSLLMDQGVLAGIGNIFADEILFQAGLDPRLSVQSLTPAAREALFRTMKTVLKTAAACHAGAEQFWEHLPCDYLMPHRHHGGHCPRCQRPLTITKIGGRSSYFCPHCQQSGD